MRKTLVFVPTPGMGHLQSTIELAKRIVHRDDRLSVLVLIINFPFDASAVNSYVDSQSRDSDPSRLSFLTLPPLSNPPDPKAPNFFDLLIQLYKPIVKQTVNDRVGSGSPKPVGFVLDMFCTPMIDVANDLNVPSYMFFTSGAAFLNIMLHFQSLAHEKGVDPNSEFIDPDTELDVPGFMNRVPRKVVPAVLLEKNGGASMAQHTKRFRESNGILVNTLMELDSYAVKSLMDLHAKGEIPAVYPLGPILDLENKSLGGSKKEEKDSIMRWLDEQPKSSVVFLCFGSMGSFDEDQVKEIANGLDRAGHRFLWSLRLPDLESKFGRGKHETTLVDPLPEGFLGRTAQRGKIIGWAPQASILAHPSIGGFVSHCGWNSILESLWFGVPIATWPMYAEQQLNAFELVKELGLAVEIRMDYWRDWLSKQRNFVVTAQEVENGVKKLMSMDKEMRERVKEMSDKCRKALGGGGSTSTYLDRFIADLSI